MSAVELKSCNDLCEYRLLGECQLYSKPCDPNCDLYKPDAIERLAHIVTCQEQALGLYKAIVDDLMVIALQHVSADAEELKGITAKIKEVATARAEI